MVRKELITRSPIRILEQSTHGGVGKGNIGVIAARKGVGKTACLVHIATDRLFQERHVIHVSFSSDTSHIMTWYEDIFSELARRHNLDCAMDIHDDIIRHRVIMNFRQDGVTVPQTLRSIRSMIRDGGFSADLVVVDGYDLSRISDEEFASYKKFAEELGIELWFSATTHREDPRVDENGVPMFLSKIARNIAILILMQPRGEYVHLRLAKDHEVWPVSDLHLKLDPQILLIAEE